MKGINIMQRKRRRVAWVILGLAVSLAVGSASPARADAAAAGGSADEIRQLREQIEQLNQKVLVIERKAENDKEAKAAKDKTTPVISLKDGRFTIKTPDDQYQLRISGWVATDFAWIDSGKALQTSFGKEQDGAGFRSARIRINSKLTDLIEAQAEYEFAGENGQDTPAFFDTYLQVNGIPYVPGRAEGELRIGHFREPFSLEELTSQPARTFQERSLLAVYNPSRNLGVQWSDALFGDKTFERFSYQIGVFKTTDNWPSSNDSDEDQGWSITARATGLPYFADAGNRLLHIGAAYSHRNPDGAVLAWNVRPETRLALFRYVNADATAPTPPAAGFRLRDARADDVDLFNIEGALKWGPALLQAEYTLANVDTTFGGSRTFSGYYVQGSYVLTGESRTYRHANGTFDKVKPKKDFGFKEGNGWGAWEVAARYASVDLEDGPVRAGKQSSLTGGINWFLTNNVTASLNYIHNWVENDLVDDDFSVIQTRVRFDF